MLRLLLILVQLAADAVRWCGLVLRSQRSVEAENLFLRRQLALYVERSVEPRRIDSVTRVALALLSRFFTPAGRSGGGAPGNDDPLAPSGMETVVALEVATRPSIDSG